MPVACFAGGVQVQWQLLKDGGRRLARAGLSVWPDAGPSAPDPAGFAAAARAFGYPDAPFDALLRAVRLRFHPWALGPLDAVDMGIMLDLARRFPVDAGGGHP